MTFYDRGGRMTVLTPLATGLNNHVKWSSFYTRTQRTDRQTDRIAISISRQCADAR